MTPDRRAWQAMGRAAWKLIAHGNSIEATYTFLKLRYGFGFSDENLIQAALYAAHKLRPEEEEAFCARHNKHADTSSEIGDPKE